MSKAILVGLCVAAAAVFGAVGQASAEFKAREEKTTGKGEGYALTVEAGGATIECASIETSSPESWTISNGKEASKKGSVLKSAVKWGECKAGSELLKGAAKAEGCEMEVKEPGEQAKVADSIISTCTLIGPFSCEITLIPESNKELKTAELAYSGVENKNLYLEAVLEGATTKVSKGCEAVGVKATKEAKVSAIEVLEQVAPGTLQPVFWLTAPVRLTAGAPAGEAKIKNETGVAAMLRAFDTTQTPGGSYLKIENEMTCRTKNYANNEECATKAKRDSAPPRVGKLKWRIETMNGGVAELDTLIGT